MNDLHKYYAKISFKDLKKFQFRKPLLMEESRLSGAQSLRSITQRLANHSKIEELICRGAFDWINSQIFREQHGENLQNK